MANKSPSSRLPRIALRLAVLGVAVGAIVLIFDPFGRSEGSVGTAGNPLVLVLSPSHGKDLKPGDLEGLAKLLQADSGLTVSVRVSSSPVEAIDSFKKSADVGLLDIFEYMLARTRHGVHARLQVTRKDDAVSYTGEVLVRADSPAKVLSDLEGKRIAYVTPYSTGGFIFPAWLLAENKVKMVHEFAGSHPEALQRLRDGKVEAAAVYSGAAKAGEPFRVLGITRTIPNEPVFLREGLEKKKGDAIVAALAKVGLDANGKRILAAMADCTGFRPASESDYDPVRMALQAAGKTVYEVVPEGVSLEPK